MFVQLQFVTTWKRKDSEACRWKVFSQVYSKQKTNCDVTRHLGTSFYCKQILFNKKLSWTNGKPLKEILENGDGFRVQWGNIT